MRQDPPQMHRRRGFATPLLLASIMASAPFASAEDSIEIPEALVTVIQQVRVPALSSGAIIKMNVAEGDLVEVGQIVAQLDDREPMLAKSKAKSEYETAVKAAESQLAVQLATKKYELAKSDLQRAERARSMLVGSVPDEEYENRKLQLERSALEIEKTKEDRQIALAQAELYANDFRTAELGLKLTRVVSPIVGVVVSIERHRGEWAKTGETVLELVGTTRLRAGALISVSEISQPLVGKRVTLTVKMPDGSSEQFKGVMRFESPEINPLDNRVSVWAEIANPKRRLRPGMRGRMTVSLAEGDTENGVSESPTQLPVIRSTTAAVDSK